MIGRSRYALLIPRRAVFESSSISVPRSGSSSYCRRFSSVPWRLVTSDRRGSPASLDAFGSHFGVRSFTSRGHSPPRYFFTYKVPGAVWGLRGCPCAPDVVVVSDRQRSESSIRISSSAFHVGLERRSSDWWYLPFPLFVWRPCR